MRLIRCLRILHVGFNFLEDDFASRPVDLSHSAGQQVNNPFSLAPGRSKLAKLNRFINPRTGLNTEPLVNCVGPADFQIESPQPGEIHFAGRCERHGRGHRAKLLQLLQGE